MSRHPAFAAETRDWLRKAASDLRVAELARFAAPPLLDQCAYHAQQAAEKALKAFLVWHAQIFRNTHDLAELGRQVIAIDGTLTEVVRRVEPLGAYAWQYRYPGAAGDPSAAEADEALEAATQAFAAICVRLPPEALP